MESIDEIRKDYQLTRLDEDNLKELSDILLPSVDEFAEDFYSYLMKEPYTASFFETEAGRKRREETIKKWLEDLLTARYDNRYLVRLRRIGKVHVKIGLKGHYVNASLNHIRNFCHRQVTEIVADADRRSELLDTLNKVLDINLDVMTSSYRDAELKKVFVSHRVESLLIRWSERLLHGLNLVLLIGLLAMAVGVASLLAHDVVYAFTTSLESGVIKALGSLLILWMMIELLHTQVEHLRGGRIHVRIFVELALVAFIRKLFVASIEEKDPITFGLLIGGLFTMGILLYFLAKAEHTRQTM
jgi:uncharacterized membrane protein (DUF373 family)